MNQLTDKLSSIIKAALPKKYTSVSYAIMQDGEIKAADSIGFRDGKTKEPSDLGCTYNVASVSKIFCTVAVMQLVEKGLLNLDTPVYCYLPRFNMPLDNRYRKITLRHCLNHTSGLPGTQWRRFSVSDDSRGGYYDDVYDYLSKSTLKAEPGEYAVYCNDGFTLAEMTVSQVTGMEFGQYCIEHIMEPIGAESTRHCHHINPRHPIIREGGKPAELLPIQGGAGITTSMSDLCKFGQLFLVENNVISEASKKEMARHQGKTFLQADDRTQLYGLGWDNVDYVHEEYDLGEGVLLKGGNSFQFDTQFIIIPKYNTVLAISETHDCKLNINSMILRLFGTMMLQKGINIYTRYKPVPKDIIDKFGGTYLTPSGAISVRIDGAVADIVREATRDYGGAVYHDLWYDGRVFQGDKGQKFFFEEHEKDCFIMTTLHTRSFGVAMKAKDYNEGPSAWEARVNKDYVVCNTDATDMVIYEIMTGFRVSKLKGFKGNYVISFSGRSDSGVYGMFESTVHAVDDNIGRGFLRTPANPSRDLIDPIFHMEEGIEYCEAASYTYREASSLCEYNGQPFPDKPRNNGVYYIAQELKGLPEVPEGHRIMILDKQMICIYDSLFSEKYEAVKEGYIILI